MAAEVPRVVLVGMAGSGKTTVGRALAAELGWPHTDLDEIVTAGAGASVADIWASGGEVAFRALERDALRAVLGRPGPMVLSVGGGVVTDAGNRSLLRQAQVVVWLRATDVTLTDRLGDGKGRPLLSGDPAGAVARLSAERSGWYEEVADVVVDVDGLGPGAVVAAVGRAVRQAGAGSVPAVGSRSTAGSGSVAGSAPAAGSGSAAGGGSR